MRFAVDAHAIGRHLTGNEVYVRSLLREFAAADHTSTFVAYLSEHGAERWVPDRFATRHVAASPWLRLGWDLPRHLRNDQPDLLHVQYTAPLAISTPVVVTVHDISFLEHPEFFTRGRQTQLRLTVPRTIAKAARVLTVSDFSREQIVKAYPACRDKIRVIPNAADVQFRVIGRDRALHAVRDHCGIDAPFLLSVGDLQPRKNHIGLIAAFARLVAENPKLPHHLVLAGQQTWFAPKVREAARASGLGSRIHFTGFVSDHELVELYNACDCFVFPSWYEGFGLPILEAMACGCAVACSKTSAMPEVADGAGIFFNPADVEDMSRAIRDVLLHTELRTRMERLGIHRATDFSWQKSARATLDVYLEVAAEHGAGAITSSDDTLVAAIQHRR